MKEYWPLLLTGAVIGTFALVFVIAYASIKNKKEEIGFDRHMKDGEILKRLLAYAKPHWKAFLIALLLMGVSIANEIVSPLIIGRAEEMITQDFPLSRLWFYVGCYAGVLLVSLGATYLQAILLQKTGQKILSRIREDLFAHIESLSHGQLNQIPVGKLVTRVTNDTNAISMMFTNLLVNLVKNVFVILGVLIAMFAL